MKPIVAITAGDINGVGYEIILKGIADPHICEICKPIVYGNAQIAKIHAQTLSEEYRNLQFNLIEDAAQAKDGRLNMITCYPDDTPCKLGESMPEAGKASYASLKRACQDLKDGKVQSCISASKRSDISITGDGIIDGNGEWWRAVKRGKVSDVEWKDYQRMGGTEADEGKLWYPFGLKNYDDIAPDFKAQEKMRVHMIRLTDCDRVLVKGVTIQNSPKFHLIPTRCKNVIIDGVTVRCPWNAQNGDGIDISCCQDVLIVNNTVDVGDDGICMKAGGGAAALKYPPVARVLIQDNTVFHAHGGFVIGSEFSAGVEDVVVRGNVFSGTDTGLRFKSAPGRGGKTSRIYISDIYMSDIRDQALVFETSYVDVPVGTGGKAVTAQDFLPEFTDIHISNVVARDTRIGISAKGTAEMIHGISLKDCSFFCTEKKTDLSSESLLGPDGIKLENVKLITNN